MNQRKIAHEIFFRTQEDIGRNAIIVNIPEIFRGLIRQSKISFSDLEFNHLMQTWAYYSIIFGRSRIFTTLINEINFKKETVLNDPELLEELLDFKKQPTLICIAKRYKSKEIVKILRGKP